jgi:RNA polymerase sigma factor (sigma-70 family)
MPLRRLEHGGEMGSHLSALNPDDVEVAQAGGATGKQAAQRLLDAHEPLFRATVRRLHVASQDREDGLQGARLGFLEALSKFDGTKGTSLGAYARGFVIQGVLEATFKSRRFQRQVQIPSGPLDEEGADPRLAIEDHGYVRVEDTFANARVRDFVYTLDIADQDLVVELIGKGTTQTVVAETVGTSKMAISRQWTKIRRIGRDVLSATCVPMERRWNAQRRRATPEIPGCRPQQPF